MEKTVSEAINYRRSVRIFKEDEELNSDKVKQCIQQATLAATSSNLQLWEFYHITDKAILKQMTKACLGQNAAKYSKEMLVVVARKDLWRKRAKSNFLFLKAGIGNKPESEYSKREKFALSYYSKLIPTVYFDVFGILGWLKYIIFQIIGLFKPIYRQVRNSDMRIVAHKSAGLAAQNFMISMAAIGYDTCPMEGSDTLLVKRILNLSSGAEINMVIGCGIRDEKGIYGERFRVPFQDVYRKI
ncbi:MULTISPECIES: nitroreductase family protein [Croceitalea]|uniref:Nitroreductase family protein n=1 Tax=Croceitalea vernalis TaxID=3075599 RepID=A0ABU3BHQ2_9FLAO|nr:MULTISPECIES: nitroreductase family protein [unclassified Croceitalea]MDT0539872.1 nitroreductase family protein [Croceitalea sp. P059]MDT0621692.1 nitroreductase family protein [Croceitalea sp. P007]